MSDFERTINKWRTAAEGNILIDGRDGLARATIKTDMAVITVQSKVMFEGDPFYIEPDDLKTIKRADDLTVIHDGNFVGDVRVKIPERKDSELEPVEYVEGDYSVKRDDLEYVMLAASTDLTRPVITSVLFTDEFMVATDGYRLHFAYGEYYQNKTELDKNPMLDRFTLGRIKSDFRITHASGQSFITFKDRDNQVIMKVNWIKGFYPNIFSVIPEKTEINFEIPEDSRFKKVIDDDVAEVTLNDWFEFESWKEKDDIKTKFSTDIKYETKPEEPIKFGIKPKYLYEAVRKWPAKIGFNAPNTPIKIDNAIVMPMHLGD